MITLNTRQVSPAIKKGTLKEHEEFGDVLCSKCGNWRGHTNNPRFWSKGDMISCDRCGNQVARPIFHTDKGHVELDLTQ